MLDNEIPSYRKKKKSDTSKANHKSNHKHQYKYCLLIADGSPHKGIYCEICGKIRDVNYFEILKSDGHWSRMMNDDEIFEKYKGLEQFEIEDIFQRYVTLQQ